MAETNMQNTFVESTHTVDHLQEVSEANQTDSGVINFKSPVQDIQSVEKLPADIPGRSKDVNNDILDRSNDFDSDDEFLCPVGRSTPKLGDISEARVRQIASPVPALGMEDIKCMLMNVASMMGDLRQGQEAGQAKLIEVQQGLHNELVDVQQGQEAGQTKLVEVQQGQVEMQLKFQQAQEQQTIELRNFYLENIENIKLQMRQELLAESARLKAEIVSEQECLSSEIRKVSGELLINSNMIKNEVAKISLEVVDSIKKTEDNLREIKKEVSKEITEVKKRLSDMEQRGAQRLGTTNVSKSKKQVKNVKLKEGNATSDSNEDSVSSESGSENSNLDHYPRQSAGIEKLLHNDKPIFEGGNPTVFLQKLEDFIKSFRIRGNEAVKNFHVFLKGKALNWWNVAGKKDESWAQLKASVISYWFDKNKLKASWDRLVCKPHFDIERFIFRALDIQNSLRKERSVEKKIQKVAHKLPSPLREFVLMKDPKTVEQFLKDVKQIEGFQKPADSSYFYNSKYKTSGNGNNGPTSTKKKYSWDTKGNAYSPDGTCVWQNKGEHPKKGVKYVNAIFKPNFSDPNVQGYNYQDPNYQGYNYQDPNYQGYNYPDPNFQDPNLSDLYTPSSPQPQSTPQPQSSPQLQSIPQNQPLSQVALNPNPQIR